MITYVVTGGNRGLGFSIAANLVKSPGAEVVLAVRDFDRGNEAASKIGSNVSVKELDILKFYPGAHLGFQIAPCRLSGCYGRKRFAD